MSDAFIAAARYRSVVKRAVVKNKASKEKTDMDICYSLLQQRESRNELVSLKVLKATGHCTCRVFSCSHIF